MNSNQTADSAEVGEDTNASQIDALGNSDANTPAGAPPARGPAGDQPRRRASAAISVIRTPLLHRFIVPVNTKPVQRYANGQPRRRTTMWIIKAPEPQED